MTAADVRACLALRWPDSEYLSIEEAPQGSDRGGRKLDLLVVSLWRSRGLQVDGVEIKVSLSDWKRELLNAEKADFWWRHTNRFWVAVPAKLVEGVKPDLPPGWGLLSCEPGAAPKIAVRPESRTAEPLSWATCVGLMRAAADSGLNALHRAEARGRERGYKEGIEAAERKSGDRVAKAALDELRATVREFEEASGLKITDRWAGVDDLGRLVAIVRNEMRMPGWMAQSVGSAARHTAERAEALLKDARKVEIAANKISAALADEITPKLRQSA